MKVAFVKFFSRKFWMTLFGLAVLWLAYWRQVNYLYSFAGYEQAMAAQLIPAFVSLTRDFMVAFTGAVLAYLGVNGVVAWRHNTQSTVQQVTQAITQKSEVDERLVQEFAERYASDPSYARNVPDMDIETFR